MILKSVGFIFTLFFWYLILAIPVKEKLVFDYVHEFSDPYVSKSYVAFKELFAPRIRKSIPIVKEKIKEEITQVVRDQISSIIQEDSEPLEVQETLDDYDFRD